MSAIQYEEEYAKIQSDVSQRIESLRYHTPFSLPHNANLGPALVCYLICRAIKPSVVLEAGVACGVISAFILAALNKNRKGILHSIDLPPLYKRADRFVGVLIPDNLKSSWKLHRGISKRVLPELLPIIASGVDMFIHDSLQTYQNMQREFRRVTPYLASNWVMIADDVDQNPAFQEWTKTSAPTFWCTVRGEGKRSLFGIALRKYASPYRP